MRIGRYRVWIHNHGNLLLDGGAMFGSVPKALWSRSMPADEQNRILLATNSLVIDSADGRRMIVDLGCGDKWSEKERAIYGIQDPLYTPLEGVTDVLLTHLHFDHVGGISRRDGGDLLPNYPQATHYCSERNLENARHPNLREKASYLPQNVNVVEFTVIQDGQEPWPGITVHEVDGHTRGMLWVKVSDADETVVFPADLIPTATHLPVPYLTGYDIWAEKGLVEKANFLQQAVENRWIVVFEHDPDTPAGRIAFDERGRPFISEKISLDR